MSPERASQDLHELPDILEPRVQRDRRYSDHVGLPLIAHGAVLLERDDDAVQQSLGQQHAQLRAPLRRVARREYLKELLTRLGVHLVEQVLGVRREHERLAAQVPHRRLAEHGQRAGQRGQVDGGGVPADDDALGVGVGRDAGDVEVLARVVLDAREEYEGGLVAVLVDGGEDLLGGDEEVLVRLDLDHAPLRAQAVPGDLALDGVVVAGEGPPLEDDLVALLGRLVEAGHHEVQVGRERVHDDDLVGRAADNVGRLLGTVGGHVLPIGQGGVAQVGEVATDADGGPCLELGVDVLADSFGLGAQRIAHKVDALLRAITR
ncbi:unnamed protein product [Clonostachys rosea f. rosea IK726]|uniref:Uncharacterized protein n=1 Tax=Clonostachys rosea f. rosea IK726 TaxID=1349383 RepID=A0ACA9T6I6_BIOOC|nr:unnamed protein product [Clonostachys rosea f. rosea IK726]